MNKTTKALKHSDSCYNALRLAEEALENYGIEGKKSVAGIKCTEALAAIRSVLAVERSEEALADQFRDATKMVAEPVKQEPVAWMKLNDAGYEITMAESNLRHLQPIEIQKSWANATPLYAAPVDAKAIRAEERQRCIEAIRKAHDEELCDAWDCIKVIKELE